MSEENQDTQRGLDPSAYEVTEGQEYRPYVREDGVAEVTLKSILCGIVLGIVFGAANAYLGLMAGLTISTSIPVAVLTVVVFRVLGTFGSKHTILEANTSQTIGSASSSVASGVIFTIPALFLWNISPAPSLMQLTLLAMCGGLIGVLAMIPLRRYLICREHGKLPYPEGLACAEVLVASKTGGSQAAGVFWGLGVGFLIKLLTHGFQLVAKKFSVAGGSIALAIKTSPALIGVGYILGPRISTVMVAGSALSTFIIVPIVAWWGSDLVEPVFPEVELAIPNMSPGDIHNRYVRYIGAGAVAAAGVWTLICSLPVMVESFRLGIAQLGKGAKAVKQSRLDRDLSFKVVLGGVGLIVLVMIFVPGILGYIDHIGVKAIAAILVAIFAFFFVTVASRIVGMVGVTSNPTSGMTIATLLGTSLLFWLFGWTDIYGKATALMVGTAVCIAASIAGDTSQDLKTGFLLGATPRRQQLGELLGVLTSAFFVCWTVQALHEGYTIGSEELPAPQATLMKLVVDGVIDQTLPWPLIFIGIGIAALIVICRLPALAFAVGVYLPISTMAAVFLGGMLRWVLMRRRTGDDAAQTRERGVLFGSGLVGGEGLIGVAIAIWVLSSGKSKEDLKSGPIGELSALGQNLTATLAIGAVLAVIAWFALRRSPPPPDDE